MKRFMLFVLLSFPLLLATSCGDKIDPVTIFPPPDDEVVSYVEDIKPILDNYCILCHSTGKQGVERQGAPVTLNLNTYEVAVAASPLANIRIQSGTMPPIGAKPTDSERALFQAWIDQGTPDHEHQNTSLSQLWLDQGTPGEEAQ